MKFFKKNSTKLGFLAAISFAVFSFGFALSNLDDAGVVYANQVDCSQETNAEIRRVCEESQQQAADFCSGAQGADADLCAQASTDRDDRDYLWIAQTCDGASGNRRTFCTTQLNYNYVQGGITLQDGTVMNSSGDPVRSSGGNTGRFGTAESLGIPLVAADQGQLQNVFGILIRIAGALAVIFIMIGGAKYATSIGSPDRVEKAKNTILYAVIGLVVTVLAGAIMNFVVTSL